MISVLSGGTGTPKLLQGLKEVVNPSDLTIIVNTLENDYFSGVYVSADIDTVLYTMSDMINDELWYGVKNDTFITHDRLEEIGCPELLRIGDIDRATKIQKTQLMEKYGLKKACEIQARNMGIASNIIPMSEEDSDIKIVTDIGELEFHDFLIKHQSNPEVLDLKFSNVNPAEGIIESIKNSQAVIIGPSNPITSISPILEFDSVQNVIKVLEYFKKVLAQKIVSKIPWLKPVKDDEKLLSLESELKRNIVDNFAVINISQLEIIGVSEVFSGTEVQYKLSYNRKSKVVNCIDEQELKKFCDEFGFNYTDVVLDINVKIDNEQKVYKVKDIIDYVSEREKCVLSKGKWYIYNSDYIEYLESSLGELDCFEYDPKLDFTYKMYDEFILEKEKKTKEDKDV